MKCLIVEDNTTARVLMQQYLKNCFSCDVAADGSEAIYAFKAQLEKGDHYDLICLDIMMPGIGGHEALRNIRQIEEEHGTDHKRFSIQQLPQRQESAQHKGG